MQTTDLQEVVAALTAILGSDKCRSPAHLPDSSLEGHPREVDVVVDAADVDPGKEGLISIEVRERGTEPWADKPRGKEDVGFVDEMHGKHLYLPTTQLVLVSKSGFSPNALKKAKFLGINTITPDQITSGFVGEIVNNLNALTEKYFDFEFETLKTTLDPPILRPATAGDVFAEPLYHADGTKIGTLADLVRAYLNTCRPDQPSLMAATGEEKELNVEHDDPIVNGEPVYLMGVTKILHRIVRIEIKAKATVHVEEMALQHRDYDGTPYSAGKVTPGGDTHHWVLTEGADGLQGGIRVLPGGKAKDAKFYKAIFPPRPSPASDPSPRG